MMFCPNCGKKVQEGSSFCAYCGSSLLIVRKAPIEEVVQKVIVQRIEGIRNRDVKVIESLVMKEKYTKYDDWPPFELQGSDGLANEARGLRVLKEYNYEARGWRIEVFGDSAMVAFTIRYWGQIRDLTFSVRSRVSAFLAKQNGVWKIVHEHWSRFPEPRAETATQRQGETVQPGQPSP